MSKYLTVEALKALKPCDLDERIAMFPDTGKLSLKQAIKVGFTVSDLLWVAGKLGFGKECAIFAANCAKRAKQYAAGNAARYAASAAEYAASAASAARYAARYAAEYGAAEYGAAAGAAAGNAAGNAARYAAYAAEYAASAGESELQMKDIVKIFGKIDLP